jgi:hypothetical protein
MVSKYVNCKGILVFQGGFRLRPSDFRQFILPTKITIEPNIAYHPIAVFCTFAKKDTMLSKQRVPDLIVIATLGLFLILLNYTGNIGILSDYPFIFLLIMYFVGRAVTWYVINKHFDNNEDNGNNE